MNHGDSNAPEGQGLIRQAHIDPNRPDDSLWASRKAEPSDREGHEQALKRAQHALTLTSHPHELDQAAVKCLEAFCRGEANYDELIRARQKLDVRAKAATCVGISPGFSGAAVAMVCFAACHPCSETAERLSAFCLEEAIELRLAELASKRQKPPRAIRHSKCWVFLKSHLREEPGIYDEWSDYLRKTKKDCYDYGKDSREDQETRVWDTGDAHHIALTLLEASYDSDDLDEAVAEAPWLQEVQDALRKLIDDRGIDPEDIKYGAPPKTLYELLERLYPEGQEPK